MNFSDIIMKSGFQSDFSLLGDRYERKTNSMLNLKTGVENIETTMKMLKEATLCRTYEEIYPWYEQNFMKPRCD